MSDNCLKVKHVMKQDQRLKLQQFLKQSEQRLERNNENVFDLSSDTLQRISHFYNKNSKVVVSDQMEMLAREKERQKIIEAIYQEELNK